MTRKLLVIGLDGYEASIGERLMRGGALPALAELAQRSACVHLDHGAAKRTGLSWEHFSTGLAPAAANRWSAVHFDPTRYRCTQLGTALAPFTNALNVSTVVFDPPYFDLGQTRNVRGIVSWGAHDPGTRLRANPDCLLGEIRTRYGDYPAPEWIYGFTWPDAARTERMGRALVEAVRTRAEIARWLLTQRCRDWSLGLVVVSELHSAIEALWHGVDERHPLHHLPSAAIARVAIEQTYVAIDALVADLVRSCPDTAVLVFSMHGMGPNESDVASMLLLPELLYRVRYGRALLAPLERCDAAHIVERVDGAWSDHVRRGFPIDAGAERNSPAQRAWGGLRRFVPDPAKRWLKRAINGQVDVVSQRLDWMPADWYSDFWHDMDAFALPSFYDGQVRINLQGRERHGRISAHAYRETCDRVEQELRDAIDPRTGSSVVREIVRSHRSNPYEMGPTEADLVVVWDGAQSAFVHPRHGTIGPYPYRRTGGHTGHHGIAYFAEPRATPGFHGTRSAFDVVPTIADYLEGAVPAHFSGRSFLPQVMGADEPASTRNENLISS